MSISALKWRIYLCGPFRIWKDYHDQDGEPLGTDRWQYLYGWEKSIKDERMFSTWLWLSRSISKSWTAVKMLIPEMKRAPLENRRTWPRWGFRCTMLIVTKRALVESNNGLALGEHYWGTKDGWRTALMPSLQEVRRFSTKELPKGIFLRPMTDEAWN